MAHHISTPIKKIFQANITKILFVAQNRDLSLVHAWINNYLWTLARPTVRNNIILKKVFIFYISSKRLKKHS